MNQQDDQTRQDQVRRGDPQALADLFDASRERLKWMGQLRIDQRLKGRLDASDVLQEAYLEAARRLDDYADEPQLPPFLWLRLITAQKLLELHRRHLGARMRDAGREVSIYRGALPEVSSACLAEQLLGRLSTASQAAMRAEMQLRLHEAVNALEPLDREVIALRHFEELSNNETAEVLGLSKAAASNRYVRALKRLKQELDHVNF